jgi:ribosomal protein S18 acetylase RimI-like enzyme
LDVLPDVSPALGRTTLVAEVVVRLCRAEDLPQLEWFGVFSHHRELFAEALARQLRGEVIMLLGDLGGYPVGQAWIDLVKRKGQGIGYIWAVRVFPILRNHGIGSQLMESAEQALRSRGFPIAEVGVEKTNPDARRLYERLGYSVRGDVVEQYAYTTPEGVHTTHLVDQWLLHKQLDDTAASR